MRGASLAALAGTAAAAANTSLLLGAYATNWAQYHAAPYSWQPSMLSPIVPMLDEVNYAFIYFCPPPGTTPMPYWALPPYGSCSDATAYQLMSVDPHDAGFLATITGFKSTNPSLKLILSVGGWNFPSAYFSQMAATATSRATFIQSAAQWMQQYGADGVELDWEEPCSPPRSDPVEITCTDFQTVADAGGSCPQDTANIVSLFRELRAALGPSAIITVASQAARALEKEMAVSQLAAFVTRFHVMSYDYAVSDVTAVNGTSPNAPLYTPPDAPVQMSVNDTVVSYLQAGVPASKIMVGVALYGHTWYVPGLAGTAWQRYGQTPQIQGQCCGPFASTYGAKPGLGASQCGTMMYSELVAALGSGGAAATYYSNETACDIAYFSAQGADGYTAPGTWVTYNGPQSVAAIAAYAKDLGLAGVFTFDASMDTAAYELTNAIAAQLKA